jgi:hypothetical protein
LLLCAAREIFSVQFSDSNLLSLFNEVIVTIDQTRCVTHAIGATQTILGSKATVLVGTCWPDLLASHAGPEVADGLYWAIEAVFEGYVPLHFLPTQLPFRSGYVSHLALFPENQIAVRIRPSPAQAFDKFILKGLRPALTSAIGFGDVLLKGIGGPLSDIQLEDLNVISRDSQFALELLQDFRSQYVLPAVVSPVPVSIHELLTLEPDDLPRRRLNSQRVTLEYDLPDNITVYSNGAIRWAIMSLIRQLSQLVRQQSKIVINAQANGDVAEVGVMYQPTDPGMQAKHRVEPVELTNRHEIKQADWTLMMVSSLHAQLTSYGCTAWALPTEHSNISTFVMTVPLWHGPSTRQ